MKDRLLRIAIHRYWLRGDEAPLTLEARLDAEGVMVERLRATYL